MTDPDLPEPPEPGSEVVAPTSAPTVPAEELQRLGYLQEANRRFFHPIGLSLAYFPELGYLIDVLDQRDLPEGPGYLPGQLDPEFARMRADYIDGEIASRAAARTAAFGAPVQPLPGDTPVTAETIARRFHEAYERLAPTFGYETRVESAVPWEQVPEHNRRLMEAVAAEVLMPLLSPSAR